MAEQSLRRIVTWGKILGVVLMIFGGINALLGLFAFIVGAIPGVIMIYLGYLVFRSGKNAAEFIETKENVALADLLDNYGKFLMVQGIVLFVYIGLMIIMFLFFMFTFFAAFQSF